MAETSVKLMQCAIAEDGKLKVNRVGVGVGVIIYSASQKKAAGVHVLAPNSMNTKPDIPAKYCNTAIPYAIDQLQKKGANPPYSVSVVGGAVMPGTPPAISMGPKMVAAVKEALTSAKLNIKEDHTGGSQILVMTIDLDTGKTKVEIAPDA